MRSLFYQAKDAVNEAQRCDPDSIFTHFSVYKVAVLENNVERGVWTIFVGKIFIFDINFLLDCL